MAWTNPTTYSTGAVLTASSMNTFERDNMNQTLPAKSTKAGQMFYASAANTPAALAPSTSRYAMMYYDTTAAAPAWTADAVTVAVQVGRAMSTSGSDPSTSTYTTYALSTLTLPVGWNSAQVLAWGSVYVGSTGAGGDTGAVLRGRIQIGSNFSTHRPSNAMTTSENDTHAYVTHTTLVSQTSAITYPAWTSTHSTDSTQVSVALSTAAKVGDIAWAWLAYRDTNAVISTHALYTTLIRKGYYGVGPDFTVGLMYRTVTSTDLGSTFTFSGTGAGGNKDYGVMLLLQRGAQVTTSTASGAVYNSVSTFIQVSGITIPTSGHGLWFDANWQGLGATGHNWGGTTIGSTAQTGAATLSAYYSTSTGAFTTTSTNIASAVGGWSAASMKKGNAGSPIAIQGKIQGSTYNLATFKGSEVSWIAVRKS